MNRLKAGIAAAVLALTIAGPTAGAAFGGEITGGPNPKPTPVARPTTVAGSICSFSGLNDNPNQPGLFNSGKVQNWGDVVVEAKDINDPDLFGAGPGASELAPAIHDAGPGTECRGYASTD